MPGGLPYIADNGRDDNSIAHLFDLSEPGAWADALRFPSSIRVMPDMTDQPALNAVEGGGDTAPAFVPDVLSPFHDNPNGREAKDDHA